MTFGMNKHLRTPKISKIVSEITGIPEGVIVDHGDGRRDAHIQAQPVITRAEEAEDVIGLPLNDIRRMIYESHRSQGMSHDEAVATLFRDGKVTA